MPLSLLPCVSLDRRDIQRRINGFSTSHTCSMSLVVFQKWRWTEIAVTLGLVFVASLRKEWPMTFIAVRCPHCQSDQIVKRGKTARGTQRYLCQNTLCAKLTVSLGVTYAVVYTYGCGDGRILPTRCAVIDAGLDDRYRPRRADRTPPAGVGSARSAPAAASRPVSPADPG